MARDCPRPQTIGFDPLDQVALLTIPVSIRGKSMQTMLRAATAMHKEGGNGAALRRLLVRELQIVRASLRYREAVTNVELERFLKGRNNQDRLAAMEGSVERASKRLLATIDRLTRLDAVPATPAINVMANQAIVSVEGR